MLATRARYAPAGQIVHAAVLAFVSLAIFGFCFAVVGPWLGITRAERFSGSPSVLLGFGIHCSLSLGLVIWLGLVGFGRVSLREVGWRGDGFWAPLALGFGGGVVNVLWWGAVVVALGLYQPGQITARIAAFTIAQRLQFFLMGLEAAFLEETLFRGYLQRALLAKVGLPGAILATAAVALLYNFQVLRNPVGLCVGVGTTLIYGALRGRDRSLLVPAAAHFLTWQVLGSL